MPLEAQRPVAACPRLAENGDIVFFRVAVLRPALDLAEDAFQPHDPVRLCVARLAQSHLEQAVRQFHLSGVHVPDLEPLSGTLRDEVPVKALVAVELVHDERTLVCRQ